MKFFPVSRRLITPSIVTLIYIGIFIPIYSLVGDGVTVLSIFPVALAGWSLGILGGVLWSFLLLLINVVYFLLIKDLSHLDFLLKVVGPDFITIFAIGVLAGWVQSLNEKLKTELKKRSSIENALKHSEQRYRTQFENMVEGIAIDRVIYKDGNPIDWIILDVNPAYEKILFVSKEKVIGQAASSIYGATDLMKPFLSAYNEAIRTRNPVRQKTHSLIGDRELSYTVIALSEDQVAVIFTDITEQEKILIAEKEQRNLSDALRNIATALITTIQLEDVLDIILEHMEQFVFFDAADIMLIEQDRFRIKRHKGNSERGLEVFANQFSLSVDSIQTVHWMVENQCPLIIADTINSNIWTVIPETSWIRSYLSLPIFVKDKMIGILNFLSAQPGYFDNFPIERLQPFVEQAALAIENARIFDETQQRARRLGLINQIASRLTLPAELEEIQQLAVDCIVEALNIKEVGLALLNEDRTHLSLVADHPAPGNPSAKGTEIPLKNNPSMDYIFDHKTSFLSEDAQHDPRLIAVQNIMIGQGIHSILIIPLIIRGEVIGTMGCDVTEENSRFTAEEISLAETLTNLVAGRIEQARLLAVEKKRSTELAMLHETTLAITQPYELSNLLQMIIERATWLLDSSAGMLYLKSPNEDILECKVSYQNQYDPVGTILHIGEGAVGIVAQTAQALIIPDYGSWNKKPDTFHQINEPFGLLSVPVLWQSEVKGVIQLVREPDKQPFSVDDANLLSLFSSQVAISLENTKLYQEVQKRAIVDPLTGLLNRGGFSEIADREFDRAQRFQRPISILYLDLDHFKIVNDTYGHGIGDQVLIEVSSRWKLQLRKIDIIGRHGGEEFVVLLLETDLQNAILVAERLRLATEELPIQTDADKIPVTVSIGVSEFNKEMVNFYELIDRADKALYKAKMLGRNKVEAHKAVDIGNRYST